MPLKISRLVPLAALALAAGHASAVGRFVPEDPAPFESVSLRQTVDDCTFDAASVSVRQSGNRIVVERSERQCLLPGHPEVVDIRLGAFPAGEYEVELRLAHHAEPIGLLHFEVLPLPEIAVYPPPPKPISDYSGLWMNPNESGWGLSLHQGRAHALFGAIYVFGADRQPEWFTLHSGQWLSPTAWRGEVSRSRGTPWSSLTMDDFVAEHEVVGEATLDFRMRPATRSYAGSEGTATLIYSVDGVSFTRTITHQRF